MNPRRSTDDGEQVELLVCEPIDVRCPSCAQRAVVRGVGTDGSASLFGPHRLSCVSCGVVREVDGRTMTIHDDGHDPWFHAPVWFRAETSAGTVWGYHEPHLRALREWIAADHRRTTRAGGWRSTLPRRLGAAGNRADVLRAIDTLLAGQTDDRSTTRG